MNNTLTTYKIQFRSLGKGWYSVDYLDATELDTFIVNNKVQEYIINAIRIVTLELETVEYLFKGTKYVYVTGRALGSNKYDRDETPVKEETSATHTEDSQTITQSVEGKTVISDTSNENKLHKVSFFTTLYNGERESHSNGYEFTLSSGHKAIVHRSPDNKFWNTTLKEYGVSLTKNSNTRKEAINAANKLINDYGYESIVSKILTLFNERGVSVS